MKAMHLIKNRSSRGPRRCKHKSREELSSDSDDSSLEVNAPKLELQRRNGTIPHGQESSKRKSFSKLSGHDYDSSSEDEEVYVSKPEGRNGRSSHGQGSFKQKSFNTIFSQSSDSSSEGKEVNMSNPEEHNGTLLHGYGSFRNKYSNKLPCHDSDSSSEDEAICTAVPEAQSLMSTSPDEGGNKHADPINQGDSLSEIESIPDSEEEDIEDNRSPQEIFEERVELLKQMLRLKGILSLIMYQGKVHQEAQNRINGANQEAQVTYIDDESIEEEISESEQEVSESEQEVSESEEISDSDPGDSSPEDQASET